MVYRTVTALRHVPKQTRGVRKVDQILRSAESVFAEVGYEHATTNAVAVHAGISIGSLYQFFGSKEALLEAMGQRYLDQTRDALKVMLDPAGDVELTTHMTGLIEALIRLQEQRPYFLQCLGGNHTYPALQGSVNELNTVVTRYVSSFLRRITAPLEPADLTRRASVCVHLVSALLPLALAAHGKQRRKMIDEITLVLERYLAPDLAPRGAAQ